MKNQVIKVLTKEHGAKVIEYFKSLGVNTGSCKGTCSESSSSTFIYYGVIDGTFYNHNLSTVKKYNAEIIELPKEGDYPKVMWVWDNNECNALKRVVFMEKNGYYLTWNNSETLEGSKKEVYMGVWTYAKDIEPEPVIEEFTLEDIAKALGKDVNLIRIKK